MRGQGLKPSQSEDGLNAALKRCSTQKRRQAIPEKRREDALLGLRVLTTGSPNRARREGLEELYLRPLESIEEEMPGESSNRRPTHIMKFCPPEGAGRSRTRIPEQGATKRM